MRTRLAVGRVIVYKSGGIRQGDPSLRTPLLNQAKGHGSIDLRVDRSTKLF